MTINPTEGFLPDEGFPLSVAGTYAQVIPHKGLIPVVWFDERTPEQHVTDAVFPEEEFVHVLSITRNPQLTYHALTEYWRWNETATEVGVTDGADQARGRAIVVKAWRPFYEALTNVYSDTIDAKAKRKDTSYELQIIQHELQQSTDAPQSSDQSADSQTDAPDGRAYRAVEPLIETRVQERLESMIGALIEGYVGRGLLRRDLEAWDAEGPWFKQRQHRQALDEDHENRMKAYQLIEKFMPYELYSNGRYPLELGPADYWDAIEEILTAWQHQVAIGESPFPIEEMSLGSTFLAEWVTAVCRTVRMLDLTRRRYPQRVVSSLPAVFALLNPFLIDQSILSTSVRHITVLYPCILLPTADVNSYYFLTATRQGDSIAQTFFEYCHVYDNLDRWLGGSSAEPWKAAPLAPIANAAQQVQEFVMRLEDLWLYQQAEATCPHCRYLLDQIRADPFLQRLLEQRVFTDWRNAHSPTDLTAHYRQWLEAEITATHRQSPVFETP